jgi:hypothetical protein
MLSRAIAAAVMVSGPLRAIVNAMGRGRSGAFLGFTASCVLIVLGASNCAEATQIVVEVRAEPSLCNGPKGIDTGIAVSTVEGINDAELEIFQAGCTSDQTIGRLTITPSGGKDAEVGIRIVTGVGIPAGECHGPKWENCILARRTIRFLPRKANYLAVYLSAACIGKGCGEKECDRGACVDLSDIPQDGGVPDPVDANRDQNAPDAGEEDGSFNLDAGEDACVLCSGTGKTCDGKTCTVDCDQVVCRNRTPCPPQLDCVFSCPTATECEGTKCGGSKGSCTFNCMGAGSCNDIECSRASCVVNCENQPLSCNNVRLDGGNNEVKCQSNDKVTCDNVDCSGTVCKRTCGQNNVACGLGGSCAPASNCTAWADGGDGG